jgi:hypothetical protein
MSGGFFFIEYADGSVTQIEFKSTTMARKAFKMYEKEPEDNAKSWGWDTKYEVPTLSQQIRENKMTKELV